MSGTEAANVGVGMSAASVTEQSELSGLYRHVVHSSRATTVHDSSGALAFYNSACSSLLGYEADELAAVPSSTILHPADSAALAHATERAYSAGSVATRLRLVRKDGRAVEVDMAMSRMVVGDRRYLIVESTPVDAVA
ncbi:PAS domain S-box protein [Rhodococcus sp. BP-349]|uniref:PAS domain-containing protein n=1 Tax=unclassified Rhodococcus (in: high G+C Gram-positive bacteria) TaxID=192944 RepID=UPI001C9A2CD7|nr:MULTISPECIES: PAS domain-containing protein [unclassified Rhodococcus (in: high G+C Gram-positive bacteria)]MBY6540635.1 PAS domain S-box protein [Rhodococcus sp. BP-363]MBY6545340.1 PAS domain S-box protein [Rhodococcus sp. BP-369]MBY6564570.1 PAS domain S-box protein [Rhodococcus sp. BP-370]MBY6578494.1 PAS domain S-box protein [Rhodococcus sp. BP-364]MBY6587795.1 PAS domain S-box protein [Rhodococcus sp. BP-358]